MSLRARLWLIFTCIVVGTVTLISYAVSVGARKAFLSLDRVQTDAIVRQLDHEFNSVSDNLRNRAAAIARSAPVHDMAIALSSSSADPAVYLRLAGSLATEQQLDFLELLDQDGTIISSAQSPANFGLRESWTSEVSDWNQEPAFLQYVQVQQEAQLGLLTVRELRPGDRKFYVVAGRRIDSPPSPERHGFLQDLVLPGETRVFLWEQPPGSAGQLLDASGEIQMPAELRPLLQKTLSASTGLDQRIRLEPDGTTFNAHTLPRFGRNSGRPLAVFVVATSRKQLSDLQFQIRNIGLVVAIGGILLSIIVSGWWAARISRPIEELSSAAQDVAAGDWKRKVEVGSLNGKDEVARLIANFNQMTDELLRQRDRALQAERVAAWRELARRLAHELKNPLFPLQITVENLMKARQQNSSEFNEIFAESTATLLAELSNLKKIISRFSDFSKMPAPHLQSVDVTRLLEELTRLFDPQLKAAARPIKLETRFTKADATIAGDPDLLRRAFENLILNAIDAMPDGGTLRVSTSAADASVTVEIADTGTGVTDEEASRVFTPYYTTKQHGTGLGLAIVQSVISDHGARISVSSRPREGTAFRMEFQRSTVRSADASSSVLSSQA